MKIFHVTYTYLYSMAGRRDIDRTIVVDRCGSFRLLVITTDHESLGIGLLGWFLLLWDRFEIVVGRFEIVVGRCGSLWVVVGRYGSF